MEKYLSIRIQTALYISIFFISLHHVFVYLTNSSILRYTFNLQTAEVISIYGLASLFGICIYLILLKRGLTNNIKTNIYTTTLIEILCLISMYYSSIHGYVYAFIGLFFVHHLLTPYILFNLDTLFETYTHIKDRGKSRGIYLTAWNIPFIIVPIIMSTLSVSKLSIVYLASSALLLTFIFFIFTYTKDPGNIRDTEIADKPNNDLLKLLRNFFKDKLDRNSFIVQCCLHLYYGSLAIILPIYLHSVFKFEWDKIGLILAAMTMPFILIQIPFGNIEDKKHNERFLFKVGILITILATILTLLVRPNIGEDISFLLLMTFLFLSHVGCSLIEISIESRFYKHITERDHTALLIFRVARIFPYSLGILAILFIV
jgi:hypothetical protein